MVVRARLAAPPPSVREVWPYHELKSASVPASLLSLGDRRFEAESYLSTGFGIRAAIEATRAGWTRFERLANVWMPGRLKGIQVSRDFGMPFLAATQVFDVRPIPRKWLSLFPISDSEGRRVTPGTILVTRSGAVGRPALAHAPHDGMLISDDLLRVEAIDERDYGWLYAYLLSRQARAMATGAQYGHIIKHLETSHLGALPIPAVSDNIADDFSRRVRRILELRNEGHRLTLEAESRFENALGPLSIADSGGQGFVVSASSSFFNARRRLDASAHNPVVSAIRRHLASNGAGFTSIAAAGFDVWLPSRFRRIPASDGVLLIDSADLTEVNPDLTKRIADGDFGDRYNARVQSGWVLMARSGQTYGIIGTAVMAAADLEGHVVSDHVMRLKPRRNAKIEAGYLVTAMSHPTLGRPLVKALAYGSSIPEIEVADLSALDIVRLRRADESAIADLAAASAKARAEADILERAIAADASAIIDEFIVRAP